MRILIIDDSALYRKILSESCASIPDVTTTALANWSLARSKLETETFDLVLLDVFMPEMNGPEVLDALKQNWPKLPVVMVSGATGRDAEITLACLSKGAIDFIGKPAGSSFESGLEALKAEIRRVVEAVRSKIPITPTAQASNSSFIAKAASQPSTPQPSKRLNPPPFLDLVLIGVSTGGPKALSEILPQIPANFPVPILIVQHMPPVFTLSLAEQLNRVSPLNVIEAPASHHPKVGEILIAPGGKHLEVVRNSAGMLETRHTDAPPVHSCRPSVDVLFESASKCALRGAVAVVLTGMGSDGADGVAKLKAALPTWCIAQNAETCAVFGMPQAVIGAGLDDECLPLAEIAPRLNKLFRVGI